MAKVIIPNNNYIDLLNDKIQTVVIDANLIIPPDRSSINSINGAKLKVPFEKYSHFFIDPVLRIFKSIAIHEAVYEELVVIDQIKEYIDIKISSGQIKYLENKNLNNSEKQIYDTVEKSVSQFTNYNPSTNNSADRGEVKSIAYAVAKNLLYFSTNDSNAISLLERSDLEPYLHSLGAIKIYELIYTIRKIEGNNNAIRGLYKLLYHITSWEKKNNFTWEEFVLECEKHYDSFFD